MRSLLRGKPHRPLFVTVGVAHQMLSCLDQVLVGGTRPTFISWCLGNLVACAGAQGLQRFQFKVIRHEACRAIGEREVGSPWMAAAKSAHSILQGRKIAARRHQVVDRHRGTERDVRKGGRVRDKSPPSPTGGERCSGPKNRPKAVELRIVMVSFAEEESITGAVGDVRRGERCYPSASLGETHLRARDSCDLLKVRRRPPRQRGYSALATFPVQGRPTRSVSSHRRTRSWLPLDGRCQIRTLDPPASRNRRQAAPGS